MTLSIHLSTCWAVFHDYNVSNPPVEGSKTSYRRLAPKSLYKNNSSLKTCNLVLPFLAIQGDVCMLSLFLKPTLFQDSYGEKHVLCKTSSKNPTIPFMDLLKNARTTKTSICWAFGGYPVPPSWWLWEKYIQSPGVFSTSAGTKGHPNKHQRWWGLCSKTQTLKFKYDVCLEPGKISPPGVTKFGQLKMIQNAWSPVIKYKIFQGCPLPIMLKEDAILNFLRSFFLLLLLGARRPILPSSHVSNVSSYRNLTSPANTKL